MSLQIGVGSLQGGLRHDQQDHPGPQVHGHTRLGPHHRGPCSPRLLQLRQGGDGV